MNTTRLSSSVNKTSFPCSFGHVATSAETPSGGWAVTAVAKAALSCLSAPSASFLWLVGAKAAQSGNRGSSWRGRERRSCPSLDAYLELGRSRKFLQFACSATRPSASGCGPEISLIPAHPHPKLDGGQRARAHRQLWIVSSGFATRKGGGQEFQSIGNRGRLAGQKSSPDSVQTHRR